MSQISDNSYKEWLRESIQDGSISCCPENDITLDRKTHIGVGAFGVVYKATIRPGSGFATIIKTMLDERHNVSGMTVAVKMLRLYDYGECEEDFHRQFIKEVAYYFLLRLHSYVRLHYLFLLE